MNETMTDLPPGAVIARTWGECADHLEAHGDMGGEVWWQQRRDGGSWEVATWTADEFRQKVGRPGDGCWPARALIPPRWRESTDPNEMAAAVADRVKVQVDRPGEGWGPTVCETAESFADRLRLGCRYRIPADWEPCATDPCEARRERLAAVPDVPDGHELVVLPTWWANTIVGGVTGELGKRAAEAVARRPKPETERVPWWELPGRWLSSGRHVNYVRRSAEGRVDFTSDGPGGTYWHLPVAPDGTVEVLR